MQQVYSLCAPIQRIHIFKHVKFSPGTFTLNPFHALLLSLHVRDIAKTNQHSYTTRPEPFVSFGDSRNCWINIIMGNILMC